MEKIEASTDGFDLSITILYIGVFIFGYPLLKFVLFVLYAVYKWLRPMPDLKRKYCGEENACWAVVTGATDGIGQGFCKVLTKMGFNIVLISRNPEKLATTVELLEDMQGAKQQKSQFKTISFDFRDSSNSSRIDSLISQLQSLDISLLINNVGVSCLGLHKEVRHQTVVDLLNVNCVSMTIMLARLIEKMSKRKPKSGIINVSSVAGDRGIPFMGLYSGSKSFTNKLTEGLSFQYPNVDMLLLKPILVESKMSRMRSNRFVTTAQQCAMSGLKELVYERETYGNFMHQICGYVYYNLIPNIIFDNLIANAIKSIFKIKSD